MRYWSELHFSPGAPLSQTFKRVVDNFQNVYDDDERAAAYAALDFPGTYYLAFRDIPAIIEKHVSGKKALDFGCGSGRSARFLKALGFDVAGIDISESMIKHAERGDPRGEYLHVLDGDYRALGDRRFDLIFSAFAFDNIPGRDHRVDLLRALAAFLTPNGRVIILGSTPDIYVNEWLSFTTRDFADNAPVTSGNEVRIVMRDVPDSRPVVDIVWFDGDYRELFTAAAFEIVAEYRPLGRATEPFAWVSETRIAPWVIYVIARNVRR